MRLEIKRWRAVVAAATVATLAAIGACTPGTGDVQQRGKTAAADGRVVALGGGARVVFTKPLTEDARLKVTTAHAPAQPPGWQPLAEPVHLHLAGGDLTTGATLEFPIPAGTPRDAATVGVATYDTTTGTWRPVPSTVDRTRGVVRAFTTHFSWWQPWSWDWAELFADANQAVGRIVGKRAGPAECERSRSHPGWVADVIGVTNEDARPIRSCVQREGDVLDIQLVNNRPYGQVLTYGSAVKWGWHAEANSLVGAAANAVMDVVVGPGALYLPPKGRASIGILPVSSGRKVDFHIGPTAGSLTADIITSFAPDLVGKAGEQLGHALVAQCGAYLASAEKIDTSVSMDTIRADIVAAIPCIKAAFIQLVRKGVLDAVRVQRLAATLDKLKSAKAVATKVSWVLKGYEWEWNAGDLFLDQYLAIPGLGWGIAVRAGNGATGPAGIDVIAPGRLGPLTVGMSAQDGQRLGLVRRSADGVCDSKWAEAGPVNRRLVRLEFRYGASADDLDNIMVMRPENYGDAEHAAPSPVHTSEGVKVGTTAAQLHAKYGNRLTHGEFTGEGGDYEAEVLFGPDGALLFGVYPHQEGVERVQWMTATAGTSIDQVSPGPGGC